MKKNKTRIGALLMAMVMIFTMLPLNTMAAFVGSETGTEIVDWPGGNANVDKGYGAVWGQFTRFTLVKLNFAHNDPQISDPAKLKDLGATEIIGSIDVAPNNLTGKTGYGVGVTKTDAEKVNTWWDTNALSYLIAAENGGTDGVSRAQNVWSYAEKSMNADTKNSANSWVSEQFLTYEELLNKLTISDSSAPANLPVWGAQGLGSNYLASIFSDSSNTGDSGLGQNGQSNEFFDQFLRVISKRKVTAKEFGDIHGTKESGGYTYRLLVEPGWVMAINGNRCAATLRDMAAYVVSEWDAYSLKYLGGHTNGTGIPSASAGGKLWYAHYNGSRQLAYGLFTGQDEFFAYQWADGSSTPLPVDSEGKTVFMKPVENTSSAKNDAAYNLGWFAGTMFGIGGNGIRSTADASYSTAKYSVGQCVGYGLGIVSPYDFKPNGLTVEKVLAGDIEPSMIDHEWEFSLHYNDGARPNNVVLTANGNAVAKEDTSDGFKFKVRADAPVNITFERDDSSDHIFYYIEETDPQATNYAQSITMNGEDVTKNKVANGNTSGTMHCVFTNSAGLTISKKVEGGGAFADEEFNFDIICSNAQWQGLSAAEAGSVPVIYSNGQKDTFNLSIGVDGNNRGEFSLKNGESVRVLIPGDWQYQITEARAGTGEFSTTVNGDQLEGTSFYSSTATLNPKAEFINSKGYNAKAHVVIDYNFNGAPATDESGNPGIDLSTIVDCGKHQVGDNVPLHPVIQTSNGTHSLGPNDKG